MRKQFLSTTYIHLLLCIYLSTNIPIYAQPLFNGSRNATLSHSTVSIPGISWADVNPSSLASLKHTSLSFFASEGYSIREMRSSAINFALPARRFVYGLMVQSFGYEMYKDVKLTTTIGHRVSFGSSRHVSIGASFLINRISIRHIGRQYSTALSFGLITEIWQRLYLGASVRQVLGRMNTSAIEEDFRLGIGYRLAEGAWILASVQKAISYETSVSLGLESRLDPGIILRFSMSTKPYRIALGADFKLNTLSVGILAEKHIILNWTPALSVSLSF